MTLYTHCLCCLEPNVGGLQHLLTCLVVRGSLCASHPPLVVAPKSRCLRTVVLSVSSHLVAVAAVPGTGGHIALASRSLNRFCIGEPLLVCHSLDRAVHRPHALLLFLCCLHLLHLPLFRKKRAAYQRFFFSIQLYSLETLL